MARLDLPPQIPLFPLSGALLLPRARLPLHIFEPRYLQMLEDVLKSGHRLIGMVQPMGKGFAKVGSAGRVVAFSEGEDGRMMISLRAISRFRLGDTEQGFRPYLMGQADWRGFERDRGPEEHCTFDREAFLDRLLRFMAERGLATDENDLRNAGTEALINSLAMLLPFETEEKQALLEADTLSARCRILDGLIEFALLSGGEEPLQ
ncbi:MAG: LON peptidase substrate-binding domain-containing protein [Paracoccus sp. (in: a-proteobacteria)]|nr:LON peptidase substrate-binding domain-containing protein [Paracoccus sp. (in: a-proteobacteria)]